MRLRRALAAALLLGAASCRDGGDDDGDGDASGDAAATTTAGPGEDATTTTAGGPTPDTALDCPPPENVFGQGDVVETTHADGDVDGDGATDSVYSFATTEGVRVQAELAGGAIVAEDLDEANGPAGLESTADFDGNGDDELWVHVGRGASTDVYRLYDLDGCDLEPVQLGGGPAEFAVGGPVLLLQGVRCEDDGRITHLGATSDDGETYTALELVYELRNGELVRVGDANATLTAADPALQAYTTFDC